MNKNRRALSVFTQRNVNYCSIQIDQLVPSKYQPRKYFDLASLETLALTIKEHGVLEPLLVRALSLNLYEVLSGERRLRAAKIAGLSEINVVVLDVDDIQALEIAILDNLQRENLNIIEEVQSVIALLAVKLNLPEEKVKPLLYRVDKELKKKTAHNVVGSFEINVIKDTLAGLGLKLNSFVGHKLPLLALPEHLLESLYKGELDYTKARAIAQLKNSLKEEELLDKTIKENLSLSQVRAYVRAIQKEEKNNDVESDAEIQRQEPDCKSEVYEPKKIIEDVAQKLKLSQESRLWEINSNKWEKLKVLLENVLAVLTEE